MPIRCFFGRNEKNRAECKFFLLQPFDITTIKESFHVWIKVASIIYSIQTVLTYGKAKEQHAFVDSFTRLNKAQEDIKFISDLKED